MIPIDPLTTTIGVLVWLAFRKQANTNFGQMTPERDEVFQNAMSFLKDPNRMYILADEFQKEGLKFQALLLRKRAEWRARTADVQEKHNEIFVKAMQSENIKGILGVANAFEEMTATHKAAQLRAHATEVHQRNLEKAKSEKKKIVEAPPATQAQKVPHESNGIAVPTESIEEERSAEVYGNRHG